MAACAPLLHAGKMQLFCADGLDGEGLLDADLPLRRRAEMQEEYFCYLTRELAPRILELNAAGGKTPKTSLWCAGVDIGAYQAVNCRLRRPAPVYRCGGSVRPVRPASFCTGAKDRPG